MTDHNPFVLFADIRVGALVDHEDNGMMGVLRVTPRGDGAVP